MLCKRRYVLYLCPDKKTWRIDERVTTYIMIRSTLSVKSEHRVPRLHKNKCSGNKTCLMVVEVKYSKRFNTCTGHRTSISGMLRILTMLCARGLPDIKFE